MQRGRIFNWIVQKVCIRLMTLQIRLLQTAFGSGDLGLGAALDKSWDVLENRKIEMPWESDLWKSVFSNRPLTNLECNFTRPAVEPLPIVSNPASSSVEMATSSRKRAKVQHWKFVIAEVDEMTWLEQLAKREKALKRWFDILKGNQEGYSFILQFKALNGVSRKLKMLSDNLATRSPLTLVKRVNPLHRYCSFLEERHILFPGTEQDLYEYMCVQKDNGAPKSRLKSLVESLRFCQHVVGFDGTPEEVLSRRVLGASSSIQQGLHLRRLVEELRFLHKILDDVTEENWDRFAAGAIC